MTELEVLRILSLIGIGFGAVAFWYSIRSILQANGTRPILLVLGLTAAWTILFSVLIADLTFHLKEINATGRQEVWVYFVRIFSWPVSLAIIWLRWKNDRMHSKPIVGHATISIPVTITPDGKMEQ